MTKFEIAEGHVHVEVVGALSEIMTDVTILLKVIYEHLDGEDKDAFRFIMTEALAAPDFLAWDGTPLPGQNEKVEMAPGIGKLLEALKNRKEAQDESGT